LLNRIKQVCFRRNAKHNQVARILWLAKSAPGFQASVPNLDDLTGKRQVGANQDIAILGQLHFSY
jgi:hypothetical protein